MKRYFSVGIGFIFFLQACTHIRQTSVEPPDIKSPVDHSSCRIMFYNVENLFDVYDDPLTNDDEYVLNGERGWNVLRYKQKLNKLYKVIAAVGEWNPPLIIGLCEIENRSVLTDLVTETPLSKYNYQVVHHDSPDHRGIDVAVLYRKEEFTLLGSGFYKVVFKNEPSRQTRDIVYIKGFINRCDTVYAFFNHWPSRRGGVDATEKYRVVAARLLKEKIDSILAVNAKSKIIVSGDFNDEPTDKSLHQVLEAQITDKEIKENAMYNLTGFEAAEQNQGTIKYQGNWMCFDQFIVSGSLLLSNTCHTSHEDFGIFCKDFLLVEDKTYLGMRPFRTYEGPIYKNGFSDHLPVYLDLLLK